MMAVAAAVGAVGGWLGLVVSYEGSVAPRLAPGLGRHHRARLTCSPRRSFARRGACGRGDPPRRNAGGRHGSAWPCA